MSLPAPDGCNATTADNLARETQSQITSNEIDDAGVIDVTATCETTVGSSSGAAVTGPVFLLLSGSLHLASSKLGTAKSL